MLGSFFGVWYFFNIFFNIYNKQVLKTFPYPFTITCLQFAVGSVIACLYWLTGAQRPKLRKQDIKIIFPLACVVSPSPPHCRELFCFPASITRI